MTLNRRKFIKTAALGGASVAGSSGIFFPKPANAYSINYLLSLDGRSDAVFNNFLQTNIARNVSDTVMTDNNAVRAAVQSTQQQFNDRAFNDNPTPFAQRLGNPNTPIWGRQRQEEVGPNPGFGTVQIVRNLAKPIAFTGSTTAGIDRAVLILKGDEKLNPLEVDNALIPLEEEFEDFGTWLGDIDARTGQPTGSSLTRYGTSYGHVIKQYSVLEEGPEGRGVIIFDVFGGNTVRTTIRINVDFG